jgi:hypothetical protein
LAIIGTLIIAARYLNEWLEWKYRYQGSGGRMADKDGLVFARVRQKGHPFGLYNKMAIQFKRTLEKAGFGSRKEDGIYKRRNISFHSFRRFVKTTIANRARNSDYSEFFLGHSLSTYWPSKPKERRQIYKEDCIKYLTIFDYASMQEISSNLESKMKRLEKENQELKAQLQHVELTKQSEINETTNAIADLTSTVAQLQKAVKELESKQK